MTPVRGLFNLQRVTAHRLRTTVLEESWEWQALSCSVFTHSSSAYVECSRIKDSH